MRKLVSRQAAGAYCVETWEWPSTVLKVDKRISILVPCGNCSVNSDFPVLYLLHGFGGNRETWLRRTQLLKRLEGTDIIVVLPESGRRWFINDYRGFRYEDYLLGEVLPFVEDCYPVHRDAGDRAIGGFSMGGAAALMHALRHPELFSLVVSHAGAFEAPMREGDPYAHLRAARDIAIPTMEAHERVWGPPGSWVRQAYDLYALVEDLATGSRLAVYADVGTEDYPRIIEMNRRMVRALRQAGVCTEFRERPGKHDFDFVDQALDSSLAFVAKRLAGIRNGGK